MITRIQAERYRCFKHLDVDLTAYQVIVGVNGVGKSTLLDIPVLLGQIQRDRIIEAFLPTRIADGGQRRVHRLREIIHRLDGSTFSFAVEARLPEAVVAELRGPAADLAKTRRCEPGVIRYEVAFGLRGDEDIEVTREYLYLLPAGSTAPRPSSGPAPVITDERDIPPTWFAILERTGTTQPTIHGEYQPKWLFPAIFKDNSRLGLAAIPTGAANFAAVTWFQEHLRALSTVYDPDWRGLQRPVPPSSQVLIHPQALNVPVRARWLQENMPDVFKEWVGHVSTGLSNVTDIRAEVNPGDSHHYLNVFYTSGFTVASSGLSEGTWRLLALTLPAYLPAGSVPAWIGIEEPETALHPHAISTVLNSLSSLYDSQVLVTTHSPLVLSKTEVNNIIVLSRDETGAVTAMRGEQHPGLKGWKHDVSLGMLFASGVLS